MKVAFFHDTPMLKDSNGFYYSNGLKYEIWERYLKVFDELISCTRERYTECSKESCSSGKGVCFRNCLEYNTVPDAIIHYNKIKNHIQKIINEVDMCIIRVPSKIGYFAVEECVKQNKLYIVEVVGCQWDAYWNYSVVGKVLAPIMTLLMKRCVKNATHCVYVTNEFLQHRYPTMGANIACSDVELEPMTELVLKKRLEKNRKLNYFKLATTAAVDVIYKGQEYVIRAIAQLKRKGYVCEYYLAGAGSQDYLKSIAQKYDVEDSIIFLGAIPHDKVFELLDDIDIYIQPSKQEGLPRAVIEAMSRGCPIIGSNTGGIPELCNPKYLFKNGNVEQIVDLVIAMSENLDEESRRSFNEAKQYQKELLEQRRAEFFKQFRNSYHDKIREN